MADKAVDIIESRKKELEKVLTLLNIIDEKSKKNSKTIHDIVITSLLTNLDSVGFYQYYVSCALNASYLSTIYEYEKISTASEFKELFYPYVDFSEVDLTDMFVKKFISSKTAILLRLLVVNVGGAFALVHFDDLYNTLSDDNIEVNFTQDDNIISFKLNVPTLDDVKERKLKIN